MPPWRNKRKIECERCGIIVETWASGRLYCDDCKKVVRKERERRYRKSELGRATARAHRLNNKEAYRLSGQRSRERSKLKVLTHYSLGDTPTCACCGEAHIAFLAIDHINGDGRKHRASIGRTAGNAFYTWLRKENYPDGYRVLCHNCNQAIGAYGYCPHDNEAINEL